MDVSELINTFDQLMQQNSTLIQALKSANQYHPARCWVPLTAQEEMAGITPINKACQYFQDYWYQDGQDGRETRSCFGLLACDEATLELAKKVNHSKDALKALANQLQKANISHWLEVKGTLNTKYASIRESLQNSGLARLHLKQTWRHIPVIERTPVRAGFNWYSSGRSIQKITVKEAQDALLKLDTSSDHVQVQLDLLNRLSSHTPLAKVQNLAPTMRANLFFEDDKTPNRKAMNVSLPILFLAGQDGSFPAHNTPEIEAPAGRKRAIRSDRKIEDDAFLPSIRVHRYC